MNVLFYICSLSLHWVLDFKGFTSPLGTDLPVCDGWIMEQTRSSDTIAHLKNELVVSGQYLKDQNLPLLISRGVFGHLSVS